MINKTFHKILSFIKIVKENQWESEIEFFPDAKINNRNKLTTMYFLKKRFVILSSIEKIQNLTPFLFFI